MEFDVGDRVLLKLTPQIWKKILGKNQHRGLVLRYDGSFEVMGKVGVVTYRLKQFERGIMKILDHRRLGQHKKNRRNEFLVKWADGEEVSW